MNKFKRFQFQRKPVSLLGLAAILPLLGLFFADLPLTFSQPQPGSNGPKLELQQGDHICIIGNTLADRMQHDGWLETYFYSRFPKHDLVFRNLGFSGDELTLRLRSMDFGSPDQWLSGSAPVPQPKKLKDLSKVSPNRFGLTKTKADVVFAFFGYNESYAGEKGIPKFKQDLSNFISHTLKQKYNGKSAPRLVLFSPIAHEDLKNPNLPDGKENNKRLELYTQAMSEVAVNNNVTFVDLFHPSKALYAKSQEPLTLNGVHLNEHGNKLIAEVIDQALFGQEPAPKREAGYLEKIRQAVKDKNFYWFNRYRTVDGYSTFGERAFLKFTNGQSNYEVVQRELEALDVMTSNRDKLCWAVAQGRTYKVDDSNTPEFYPVITNLPGKLPGGKHLFLDGETAIEKMKVAKGMKVSLFASEKEFPDLINPVAMAWDTKGRLWVACWATYPHWKPKEPMNDKLIILEDTNGDGRADKQTIFAGDLHCPTGFEFYNGGVLVAQAPGLVFLKDTDGDDKYDQKIRVLDGLDSADTHHTANSFVLDPGGALYFQEGTFHHTQVETPWGPTTRCANAGVFRYEPRNHKFEVYVNFGFANPHGHVFDRWGQDVVVDGTGAVPFHGTLFSGQTDFPNRHGNPPHLYKQKTRPCPGMEILSSGHFPDENQGNLLVGNVIGFHGILQYKFKDKGASFEGIEVEPIVSSSDPNFRPSDIKVGPDGAIYFSDWQNPIIGHMQHNLRDPNRDVIHGRIYKVTYEGRPLLKPAKIAGEPVEKLLDLLKSPQDRVRYWTKIELGGRDTKEVIPAVQKWITTLDKKDANYEHHLMEALWMHQYHNVVNEGLLKRMLRSSDFRARAAATKTLCYWRDRVKEPLKLLQVQINDTHPRVRLEAIRALSFFHDEEAMTIAVELLAHPDDEYLRFTFNETMNTLERRFGSAKLDRKNVAASLLNMLEKGKVDPNREPLLIETICKLGGEKELATIWARAAKPQVYSPALRENIFAWLTEAAATRKVKPKVSSTEVAAVLKETAYKDSLQIEAIRLAAAWNIKESGTTLRQLASDGKAKLGIRFAAIDGLTKLADADSKKTLQELTAATQPIAVRFRAAVALSQFDLDAAASAAASALAAAKESDDLGPVVEGFLVRKNGGKKLGEALEKSKISADTAKQILKEMYLAGQNDPALSGVVSKLAGLGASPKPPTAEEVNELIKLVQAKGDAKRGEFVFRRADLGCLKCHSINKAGGNIGPDLGPIGGSSPVDYIIRSILDPNQSIKEEYLTKLIATTNGQFITGIEVERNKNQVVLKDATGKIHRIPVAEIDEETKGKSLMPEGVTQILTKNELLDLIAFVSVLGKPEGPYANPKVPTIQRWKVLRKVPASLLTGIPNRDEVRDAILQAAPESWQTAYSQFNGNLLLEGLRKADAPKVLYLQGEIQVVQAGPVELKVNSSEKTVFWVDEEPYEKQGKAVVDLSPGRHRITVRVVVETAKTPTLSVELGKPADSKAHFEVVHGE